jgi:hypothetical protein
MTLTINNLPAVIALVFGIIILFNPKFLNYLIAIYLILVGLMGLGILG